MYVEPALERLSAFSTASLMVLLMDSIKPEAAGFSEAVLQLLTVRISDAR